MESEAMFFNGRLFADDNSIQHASKKNLIEIEFALNHDICVQDELSKMVVKKSF
jgi:hypothetical protein